ncbi:MGDG synthase family glycosyltransferase [Acetobacterium bakii]|uniref:1,2-diacylglycerol 3-glucosyltransferase n=1 Tax=Acetobacterium bakii TaxID=52689 RepID=A0A0L6TX04_9FIRM|nr:glycosyltransferase [Acetobacterium bakii]KNZ40794.1 1,2-diacylglycerol 3-glucosyltransferase [Acetobacterium bakii]
MSQPKRILILSCSHGSGHKMVAASLKEGFEAMGHTVSVQDLFNETNPTLNRFIEKSYLLSYTIGSSFYQRMYYDLEEGVHEKFIHNLWHFTDKTLLGMIENFQPDCIVNTYPYTISSIMKEDYYPDIPVFSVVTDFCIPKAWMHKNTECYYVACDNVETVLLNNGYSSSQILKTGIPIREAFYHHENRLHLMKKYGLDPNKKTLIIFAGTYGVLKDINEVCTRTDALKDLQTVVICGKNRSLQRELDLENFLNTKIFGYVSNIHEFYSIGDLMVTKPGGITLSEVIVKKIPVILYNPTPGQEGENAQWFKQQGAAVVTNTTSELILAIEGLKDNEIKRFSMKNTLRKMHYGHSTTLIVQDVLKRLAAIKDISYLNATN